MNPKLAFISVISLAVSSTHADIYTSDQGLGVDPVIDFEDTPVGVVNGDEWQAETGIVFDALLLYVENFFTNPGASGNKLAGDMGTLELNMTFDDPQTQLAMAWGTNPGTSTVTAYLDGAVVETATLDTTFIDPGTTFLIVENITFDRVEIDINAAIFDFSLDNVQLGGDRAAPCPADIDGSGSVDVGDLITVLSAWGSDGGPADIDGNGFVNLFDLLGVISAWGACS